MNFKPMVMFSVTVSVLFIASLTHCSEPVGPSTHTVRAIELMALESMLSQEDFTGFMVAMASWCPPCREELPMLAELYRVYEKQGIDIVAISVDAGGPSAVQPLINELDIPFPVYWAGPAAAQHFRLVGIPTLMVYDHGRLVEKIPGSQTRRAVEKKIKTLLLSTR